MKKRPVFAIATVLLLPSLLIARGKAPSPASGIHPPAPAVTPWAQAEGERIFLKTFATVPSTATLEGPAYFAVWNSLVNGHTTLYSERFDDQGVPAWAAPGRILAQDLIRAGTWDACTDGASGLILALIENGQLHVRHLDQNNHALWDRIPSKDVPGTPNSVVCLDDGEKGIYVAWAQENAEASQIWVERWNAEGQILWPRPGVQPSPVETFQVQPVLAHDSHGGILVGWKSTVDAVSKDRMQRLSVNGLLLWKENGVDVHIPAGNLRERILLAPTPGGGVITTWTDTVAGKNRLFFQHVASDGARSWSAGGITIPPPTTEQWNPVLLGGSQGVWIGWEDVREGGSQKIKIVRRDPPEGQTWPAGEIWLTTTQGPEGRLSLAPDHSNTGILATWVDSRTSPAIYVQHVDAQGQTSFGDGLLVASNLLHPQRPQLVPLPNYGLAVVWTEETSTGHWDLKTRVITTGCYGKGCEE